MLSRRGFLGSPLILLVECRRAPSEAGARPDAQPPPPRAATAPTEPPAPSAPPAATATAPPPMPYGVGPPPDTRPPSGSGDCLETPDNIEGPYYRKGAPQRSDLTAPGISGTPLVLSGRVLELGCSAGVAGAVLDVWQADADGHYDNDGSLAVRAGEMRLRGKLAADAQGRFSLRTVVPGRYLNGPTYRPAHLHVKISAPGFAPLTTQLYFPGDPYNEKDPFIRRPLIMKVSDAAAGAGKTATYDFVLGRA